MVFITEELVRKRAEHNEKEIFSLEELSLHQCEVERIQHLDRWCKQLRILYLQSNIISKIEHVGRLKRLEYLNLALNSIERVENLEGCDSLCKLDLTLNFIGEITSLASLQHNHELRELFLTGNPCADFAGYREWMVATLPQLRRLDGATIDHSERIAARQVFSTVRDDIVSQQAEYLGAPKLLLVLTVDMAYLNHPTNILVTPLIAVKKSVKKEKASADTSSSPVNNVNELNEEDRQKFWHETTPYTPESRLELHRQLEAARAVPPPASDTPWDTPQRTVRLLTDDGRPLNVNAAGVGFRLEDDEVGHRLVLHLDVYRYLDTSLLSVDVQPTYVTVHIKQKPFQLVLPDEVKPDSSCSQRSQVNGDLLITMPKMGDRPPVRVGPKRQLKPTADRHEVQVATDQHPDVPPLV